MSKKRRRTAGDVTHLFTLRREDVVSRIATAHINEVSEDGLRINRVRQDCPAPPPLVPAYMHFTDADLPWNPDVAKDQDDEESLDTPRHYDGPIDPPETRPAAHLGEKTFATLVHDRVLLDWAGQRDIFLDELLRLDGWNGSDREVCASCAAGSTSTPEYRCRDCMGHEVVCRACCLSAHAVHPFHRIERWNGRFFEPTTLQALGLIIQVGHKRGDFCPTPALAPRAFLVMHTNGFHPVTVQFCECHRQINAGNRVQQLLRYELYPATLEDPTTCCTFRLLETFHLLTLQSKITAYDFYVLLDRMTDRAGLQKGVDRLKPFLRMVREWRHLQLLKWAGRGHEEGGVLATKAGDLCTRCPACPRPGVNLPPNWDQMSADISFVYTTFVAIDANFRLKRRAVSSNARDPSLSSGWGYFVEGQEYRAHCLKHADQQDISTCTGFAAMLNANKSYKGYATTGVAMGVDARHGFVLPNGVGDLQKGERYCNVDWILMSAIQHLARKLKMVLTYDIMCQWLRHLMERITSLPSHLQIELPEGDVRYGIPKYHFNGHKEEGHNRYSLNLMPGVGRTDGEEIERSWSRFNALAPSTREMGPGSREETLEDHFEYNNEEKYVNLGASLDKRERTAVAAYVKFDRLYNAFVAELQPSHVAEWDALIAGHEANPDPTASDPYYWKPVGMSEAEIRLQLVVEEDSTMKDGTLHEVTPAAMLATLLDLEEAQRKFRAKYPASANGSPQQTTEVIGKRASLRHRLNAIRPVQYIYMPGVALKIAQHRQGLVTAHRRGPHSRQSTTEIDNLDLPETQPLFLPHELNPDERAACTAGLADMEARLRDGQLCDSLDRLRIHLHIRSRLVHFKDRHVRHQRPNTRARQKIDQNEVKIVALRDKYRAARAAKLVLSGPGTWERRWQPLKDTDLVTLRGDDEIVGVGTSEGKRSLSWIWMGADEGGDASGIRGLSEALRVEYLKARARKERYREEVVLVKEEKRRTLASLGHNALQWDRREGRALSLKSCNLVAEGAAAYAAARAATERALAQKFGSLWGATEADASTRAPQVDEGAEGDDKDLHIAYLQDSDSEREGSDVSEAEDDGLL